ncbi:MAG: hypothetical protein AAGC67_15325 [Myxococcota bacterium]
MKLHSADPHARLWLVGALVLALLGAPVALADGDRRLASESGRYRGECRRLTKQIDHFEGTVLPMAIARGNRGWEQATNAQIERLWHRRADLCPEYGAERTLMAKAADQTRRFNKMMASAGRAALAFFTGGAAGL